MRENKESMDRSLFDFNKEIILGEIGALIFAPLTAYIASNFSFSENFISSASVAGAIFGACLFWIFMRVLDQKRRRIFSARKFIGDVAYLTPVAFILTLIFYYPTLYLLSYTLLSGGDEVVLSVIISQLIAFSVFLLSVNIYRQILLAFTGRKL